MENALISFSKKLKATIKKKSRIAIATHIDPDFDGLAAALATGYLIRSITRRSPIMYCNSAVPVKYGFIVRNWNFVQKWPSSDLLIVVDSASLDRIFCDPDGGYELPAMIINIDHHKSNVRFGAMNYNDENASSACEIIYNIYEILKVKITRAVAETLYTGLYSETGGFVYPNTTSDTLRIAANLVRQYIKPDLVVKQINAKTVNGTRLLSKVLATIELRNGIGTMYVTKKMIAECRANMSDTENFVSFLMAINQVKVAIFLREQNDFTRISLRSNCQIDVDRVARKYGGGGHRLAAGIKMQTPLKKAMKAILLAVRKQLNDINN
ncbi:hypothetical protein A2Y85_04475 [candidate division WOR-3 bacterium RBG_13_43_14]|uniref:DDH domain-containing protein n=1 Tax=candidate division WOR-3 bacterium RBG_13_43_14 TaxID=1802590 RepID=A0A1F4U2G8_UNCW3|nr:MAG: hypothetical protein A2Y85_04475 [candidate division WOR-3 bacterium RBG_13_43_14]